MVMEAKPSPLVVGREFVRQYYTLLHNSPDHLHRFYNQHSSFTHGGLDPDPSKDDVLIIGQKNIHDKIQQLNFRDCHAKISYVDAQATLGDGVVVQVSGELSNDGHPMRRFTQTFVLACQSPKKYYVHNDIFRYQDMYNEDDDATAPRAGDEHDINESNVTSGSSDSTGSMLVSQNTVFYQAPANVVVNPSQIIPSFPPQTLQGQAPSGQVNGIMHDEMLKNISTQTQPPPQMTTIIPQVASIPIAPAAASLPLPVEPVAVAAPEVVNAVPMMAENNQYDVDQSNESETDMMDNNDPSSEEISHSAPAPSSVPAAPKNWANLVKGGPGLAFTASPLPEMNNVQQPQSFVAITQQQQQQAQQQQKVQGDGFGNGERRPMRTNNVNERERRTSGTNYNNNNQEGNNQLFLGNLPTRATEEELRQMFSVFGKISDLRIHNKPQQKNSQNRPVPNYGFITFEDPASALKLQDSQPVYYPDLKDSNGQKLNVELKIRKEGGQPPRTNGPNMDRGRNTNPGGNGMNRNGSGGRGGERRGEERGGGGGGGGNRQFNRSDRGTMGPRNGNANGTGTAGTTFNNTRR